ncbi:MULTISPECIES: DinB family protein [unclassified Arthrobacter]|uniref:DinB family protein n=1 Tax=unclassified Arthrobacter TaxID=235627 RepID=UPI00159D6E19|nr:MULTISPECIES: DinB family protein [unclassified Arthrobacter]MCQ9164793.1 DinB family protein [Arthrobacter sp. STN4]NVM98759.1 DinB family protein [Arthrobacter sp. SDTb3-6]
MDVRGERTTADYRRACRELDAYLAGATPAQLKARSAGTRWSNEELLFHMVFGYLVVRTLVPLVKAVSRLPRPWGRAFARALDASTGPFDTVNFWGSRAAALVFNRRRMARKMHATTRHLAAALERESPASLARTMDFPGRWDPFFRPSMTLADVYAYPTLHFDFHAKQLSLGADG